MTDDNGPLLFIKSVSTEAKAHNQTIFDSRKHIINSKLSAREYNKLLRIIEMYKKNRPVLCKVVTKNRVVEAIPYQLDDRILLLKTQDGKTEKLDSYLIESIEIISF
ncbi:MAG TPA: hypothetical protein GXZ48_05460 [Acholeplasmataceae bacterium]|jgi:hypothetical protein|nr:hypothetical protein [Acholeplasmataceae bacterium]